MRTKKREREAPLVWVLEIVPTDLTAIFVPAPPASLHVNDEAVFGIGPLVYVVRSCGAVVANRQWLPGSTTVSTWPAGAHSAGSADATPSGAAVSTAGHI